MVILSLVGHFGWEIHQRDVKGAFLHGDITKDIYMEQPLDIEIEVILT
jgi:hypothetical protein